MMILCNKKLRLLLFVVSFFMAALVVYKIYGGDDAFVPLSVGAIKCSISFKRENDNVPREVEVELTNITEKPIEFSSPKCVSSFNEKEQTLMRSFGVNTITMQLKWGKQWANLLYAKTDKNEFSRSPIIALKANESIKLHCLMKDMLVVRRDDVCAFNECFFRGDDEIASQLSIVYIKIDGGMENETIIASSNIDTFKAKFVDEQIAPIDTTQPPAIPPKPSATEPSSKESNNAEK